uniref:Uncharacterized protein n=1 Tax=Lactuca sativa TaxID=4236 RepID=A0A9R1VVZ7_LACSA|nr:hypothetical protein LSAT_V11C400204470 [Lactuca sativa]
MDLGHWVTHLAISYEDDTSRMVHIPIRDMGTIALRNIQVLRHQRPRHVDPDQPDPTLCSVMQRPDDIREEHRWIMASIAGVRQHLRLDHPYFPQVGPDFPTPDQLRGVGYDGDGT